MLYFRLPDFPEPNEKARDLYFHYHNLSRL
jgi:hypothetical protein